MENSHEYYNTGSAETQAPFRIEPEFQNKIPPIGEAEFQQLRENILAVNEVYEPLVVWNGVLVDGHNRWRIIQECPKVKWRVRNMEFADKWAAFDWMYKNQLGRRNLTDEQRTYLLGKMYEARKMSSGGDRKSEEFSRMQNEFLKKSNGRTMRTYDTIAKEQGVNASTVQRAERFSKGVDALREVSPEAADKVLDGKTKTTRNEVADLAKSEPDIIEAFAKAVNEGKKPERKPRKPKTEEEKRDIAEIEAIMRDMRNPNTTPEFTIDYLLEDIELNGQTYVELLVNTLKDRSNLLTDENKPLILAAINKVVDGITKVRDSI